MKLQFQKSLLHFFDIVILYSLLLHIPFHRNSLFLLVICRFCNMIVYYLKNGITVRSVWEKASISFDTLWTMAKPYVDSFISKLPPKEEVIEFVTTNWKEYVIVISVE